MSLFEKKAFFPKVSIFNNIYIAKVEVNETALHCRSLLVIQSPTHDFLDLIQNNRKFCKKIIKTVTFWDRAQKLNLITIN